MAQPTRSDVHVNRPLTNISIAYIQDQKDFIADKVFPVVPVMKQSDRYFIYTKDYWFRTQAEKRAISSESAGSGFELDNTPTYFADVWAVHKDVDDQIRANQDAPLDLDRDATMFVTQQLLLRREIQWTKKYWKTGTWTGDSGGDFTPAVKWLATNSNPINDVENEKIKMKSQTGFTPNTFVITPDVFVALKNNANIVDRIKYTQRGIITEELLAAVLGIDRLFVLQAVNNSAAEGQTGSFAFLEANSCLLLYAAPNPSILQPTAGYTFAWTGLFGAGALGTRVSSFRMEPKKSDRIEGEMAFDQKLVSTDLGIYFTAVLT